MDPQKSQDPKSAVPAKNKAPPFEGGHTTKTLACGLSKMISDQQNSIKSSSRKKSKEKLL